jgi:hypothetical protein
MMMFFGALAALLPGICAQAPRSAKATIAKKREGKRSRTWPTLP